MSEVDEVSEHNESVGTARSEPPAEDGLVAAADLTEGQVADLQRLRENEEAVARAVADAKRGYEKGWGSSDPGEGEPKGEDRWED